MRKRALLIVILLVIALPSTLLAVGMGGMGMGMGTMVDKVYLQTENVGKVEFSHSLHGTNCSMCHPRLFKKKSGSTRVGMKAMERGRSCGGCHNGRTAFSVTGDCAKCHAGDILFTDTGAGDVVFPHSVHTDMFGCDECHPDLFKAKKGANKSTMEEMEGGASCGACHDGGMAFGVAEDCESCHQM